MKFTLTYSGELKANGRPNHKHKIRQQFHLQLKNLWGQIPLSDHHHWFNPSKKKTQINLNRKVGDFRFVPLVSTDIYLFCELDIFLLRPGPPGSIITSGGDVDNRLKTLFDALRIPHNEGELPKVKHPSEDEDPFFCLLEDDALISSISVITDQLLFDSENPSDVRLNITVTTRPTRVMIGNRLVGNFALT